MDRVINIEDLDFTRDADSTALMIAELYRTWANNKSSWVTAKEELRAYIVATDTKHTSNAAQPWKNSTTNPKLCQIRDNLHANYMAALFSRDDWLKFEPSNEESATKEKAQKVEAYLTNKLNNSDFRDVVDKVVFDFIDYGNAFFRVDAVHEYKTDVETGELIPIFLGPRCSRISPLDIYFDPSATNFTKTPKIVRSLMTIGDLKKAIKNKPSLQYDEAIVDKIIAERTYFSSLSTEDRAKATGIDQDGQGGGLETYYTSGLVEVLEFYGDLYDIEKDVLYEDHVISIVDKKYILRANQNTSWQGVAPIVHVGWRYRSDNLWAMGPLDNLVGLQYRIDHLENGKSDALDLTLAPPIKIKGDVDEFVYGPAEYINVGDGDIELMSPDAASLSIDFQIDKIEARMEELAGSPKQTAGFRTPGEKTAFEVQILEDGAGRIFHAKTSKFEREGLEAAVNIMFAVSVQNFKDNDVAKILDPDGVAIFETITRDDLKAEGKIRALGARHFAADARKVQEITALYASPIAQDALIMAHLPAKPVARMLAEKLDIEFVENGRLQEEFELKQIAQILAEQAGQGQPPTEGEVDEAQAGNAQAP